MMILMHIGDEVGPALKQHKVNVYLISHSGTMSTPLNNNTSHFSFAVSLLEQKY